MIRWSLILPLALAACGGSAPDVETGVTARLRAIAASSGELTVDSLVVQVREVVFDADGPDESISLTVEQKVEADLTEGTFEDLVPIELTPGTYGSPYLGVEIWDDGPEPGLVLEGSLDGTPLRFVFNSGEVFEAEAEQVEIPEGEVRAVELTLDPSAWFVDVEVSELTLDESGVAVISETSNASVFDEVADRLDETTDGVFPGGVVEDDEE